MTLISVLYAVSVGNPLLGNSTINYWIKEYNHLVDSNRLGRKILLYISSTAMVITLATLGTFFYYKSLGNDVSTLGWLPLLSFVVYVIGFSIGFGSIPWLMMGEILPGNNQEVISRWILILLCQERLTFNIIKENYWARKNWNQLQLTLHIDLVKY